MATTSSVFGLFGPCISQESWKASPTSVIWSSTGINSHWELNTLFILGILPACGLFPARLNYHAYKLLKYSDKDYDVVTIANTKRLEGFTVFSNFYPPHTHKVPRTVDSGCSHAHICVSTQTQKCFTSSILSAHYTRILMLSLVFNFANTD